MQSRKSSMLLFVRGRYHAMLNRDALCRAPQRSYFDFVDAISPGVPLRKLWFIESIGKLHVVKLAAGQVSHLDQRRVDFAAHFSRKRARQVGTKNSVIFVLIPESRGRLLERHRVRIVNCESLIVNGSGGQYWVAVSSRVFKS